MKLPRCDFHVHTKYLGCANATMEIPAIVRECERLGVEALAITDHLNSPDQLGLHVAIREEIERLDTGIEIYFGAELNFTGCDRGFAFSGEIREKYGFQFALGGIHATYLKEYDLKKMIDIQHRHHLKTCADPLVEVLVHPYWFRKAEFDEKGWPWFETMKVVPRAYVRELGQAAKATGTAIEINGSANLSNPAFGPEYGEEYFEYLSMLAGEGVTFSLSSDAHDLSRLATAADAWKMAERLRLTPERVWRPTGKPLAGGKGKSGRGGRG